MTHVLNTVIVTVKRHTDNVIKDLLYHDTALLSVFTSLYYMTVCVVICHNLDENSKICHDKIENILILLGLR